jgi:hypothetical protein
MIAEWLAQKTDMEDGTQVTNGDGEIKTKDVALWALNLTTEKLNDGQSRKIASILRKLGYVLVRPRENSGRRYRAYVHKDSPYLLFGEYAKPDDDDGGEVPF